MIIMDDERIAAAKALRERAKRPLGKSMQLMFSETLGLYRACVGRERQTKATETWANIVNYLADLIDRPTCNAYEDWDYMEFYSPDVRVWACQRCGERFPVLRGSLPLYCPVCGAKVVRDG